MTIELVNVSFFNYEGEWEDKEYSFLNKFSIPINRNDTVDVKVGTGGSKEVLVRNIETITKEEAKEKYKGYKNILENTSLKKLTKEPLKDEHRYVYDIRIWRNQWSSDGGYNDQWSDLIKTGVSNEELYLNDNISYEDSKARIVNIRQLPISKTKNMKSIIKTTPTSKSTIRKTTTSQRAASENAWYKHTIFVMFALLFFFPVGLYLMWAYTEWHKYLKIGVSVAGAFSIITYFI